MIRNADVHSNSERGNNLKHDCISLSVPTAQGYFRSISMLCVEL